MEPGSKCWYWDPDSVLGWEAGQVAEWDAAGRKGKVEGFAKEVGAQEVVLDEEEEGYDDVAAVPVPHEAKVLHGVRRRVEAGEPDVWAGRVLLSLGHRPTQQHRHPAEGVADFTAIRQACHAPPHVWGLAATAFENLSLTGAPQVVLPVGVSGSGVTETAKSAVRYLCAGATGVGERLGWVNLVLEAFGNAGTAAHGNSSRFHRLTRLFFAPGAPLPAGASVSALLLESRRAASPPSRLDRSFHAFYLLLRSPEAASYGLDADLTVYRNLKNGPSESMYFDTPEEAEAVMEAMGLLGFPETRCREVWGAVAAVLHLQADDAGKAAQLLGLEASAAEALQLVDVDRFSAAVYAAAFASVVEMCNDALRAPPGPPPRSYITVFDLSGLYCPPADHPAPLQQLYLNASAEVVARYFTQSVVCHHVDRCRAEGILLTPPKVNDNTGCVALLTGGDGIIPAVDAAATTEEVHGVISRRCAGSEWYTEGDGCFKVRHHTGQWCAYRLEKGGEDTADFEAVTGRANPLSVADQGAARVSPRNAAEFAGDLQKLLAEAGGGEAHWARCLAVEEEEEGWVGEKDPPPLLSQLRAFSLGAVLHLQRFGFPYQISRGSFSAVNGVLRGVGDPVENILRNAGCVPRDARVTCTTVFLTNEGFRKVEAARRDAERRCAEVIVAFCRGRVAMGAAVLPLLKDALRPGVRDVVHLIEDERLARLAMQRDEVASLAAVGASSTPDYYDALLAGCGEEEAVDRFFLEEEEDEAASHLLRLRLGYGAVALLRLETAGRAQAVADEFVERTSLLRTSLSEYCDAALADEEWQEQEGRVWVEEEEAVAWRAAEWREVEGRKEFAVGVEEPRGRSWVEEEEAGAWRELVEEMSFTYMDLAYEELELVEQLGRFGYRGAGGVVIEEAEAWQLLLRLHVAAFTSFLASSFEPTARRLVSSEEAVARRSLARVVAAAQAPLLLRPAFLSSLPERRSIERDEASSRSRITSVWAEAALLLLQNGRGVGCEVGNRLLLEKRQRDARRRLHAARRGEILVVLLEPAYRAVMEEVFELEMAETAARLGLFHALDQERSGFQRRFDTRRAALLADYNKYITLTIKADARCEELFRRHTLKLAQLRCSDYYHGAFNADSSDESELSKQRSYTTMFV